MIVAHLPAGYLIARAWRRRLTPAPSGLAAWGMAGGVIPDIDMFWAICVDHGMVHHHRYVTHWPLFWLLVFGIAAAFLAVRRAGSGWLRLGVFATAVASHLFLDWIGSDIWLLAPFSDRSWQLVQISRASAPWPLNFPLPWVGALDVGIASLGMWVMARDWAVRHRKRNFAINRCTLRSRDPRWQRSPGGSGLISPASGPGIRFRSVPGSDPGRSAE